MGKDNRSFYLWCTGLGVLTCTLGATLYYEWKKSPLPPPPSQNQQEPSPEVIPQNPEPPTQIDFSPSIYFGSQSGTAESFSKEIQSILLNRGIEAPVIDLDDFDPESFSSKRLVILVVATYGEGDPTDNAIVFNKWLCSKKNRTDLSHMRFAVLGLGNSQYTRFNEMARRVERHLLRLGATAFCPRGETDDDNDMDGDFNSWLQEKFIPSIPVLKKKMIGLSPETEMGERGGVSSLALPSLSSPPRPVLPFKIVLQTGETGEGEGEGEERGKGRKERRGRGEEKRVRRGEISNPGIDLAARTLFQLHNNGKVVAISPLRQVSNLGEGEMTVEIEIDVSRCEKCSYETGDNFDILPANPAELINEWLEIIKADKLSGQKIISYELKEKNEKIPFPSGYSVYYTLQHFCDLYFLPSKTVLRSFSPYLSNEGERKDLLSLLSDQKNDEYKKKILDSQISFANFTKLFMSSLEISLEEFLSLVPRQKVRTYTIASSSLSSPSSISLILSLEQREHKEGLLGQLFDWRDGEYQCGNLIVEEKKGEERMMFSPLSPLSPISPTSPISPLLSSPHSTTCIVNSTPPRDLDDKTCVALSPPAPARQEQGKNSRKIRGLTTEWICTERLTPNTLIHFQIRPSNFRIPHSPLSSPSPTTSSPSPSPSPSPLLSSLSSPSSLSAPVIMVATGTGIAPFIGFLREFQHLQYQEETMERILFFGCRHEKKDFLHQNLIHLSLRERYLSHFYPAFSRDQNEKIYVQNRFLECYSSLLRPLIIEKNAKIFVCGSTHLGTALRKALVDGENAVVPGNGNLLLEEMKKSKRYIEELWST